MKIKTVVILFLFVLAACGRSENQQQTVTVFAASSLTDSFEDLKTAFETKHENVEIKLNFGASSALAAQINEGAEADVFASANLEQIEKVELSGDPQLLTENRLVVVVYKDTPLQTVEELASEGIKLVVAAPEVPIRVYTDTLLDSLNSEYGQGFAASVMENVVSEEDNVRQVVLKVYLGEADAAIVYATDITPDIAETVRLVEIPENYQITAQLYIGTLSDNGQDFVEFVLSDEGQAILQKWGFVPVND